MGDELRVDAPALEQYAHRVRDTARLVEQDVAQVQSCADAVFGAGWAGNAAAAAANAVVEWATAARDVTNDLSILADSLRAAAVDYAATDDSNAEGLSR